METDRNWIVVRVDGKLAGISRDYGRLAEITAEIAHKYDLARKRQKSKAEKSAVKSGQKATGRPSQAGLQIIALPHGEITATAVRFEDILEMRQTARWEDLMLFGTDFQKRVWKKLWELTTSPGQSETSGPQKNYEPRTAEESEPGKDASTDTIVDSREAQRNDVGAREASDGSKSVRLLSYSDFAELCENRAGVRPVAHAIALNPLPIIIPCHLVVPKEAIDRIKEIQRRAESTIFKGEDLCQRSILNDNAIDFGEYALGKDLKRRLISMQMAEDRPR